MEQLDQSVKPILISHELSNIGKLDITLHGIAAQFYAKLYSDGLIDYLKCLDHLGFISKCHPGNHHKRWDYVCLQLFFLQKLKHSAFKTGLNRNSLIDGQQASNQEILQTFILFSNIGHLEGTVASEKGLFDFVMKHPTQKKLFLAIIDQSVELKQLSDKIFKTCDFYKVKYLIALNYILNNKVDDRIVSAIKLLLKKYVAENDSRFEKLKILFFKIRKVSFVYLDTFHCQMPMQVNLAKILINIFNYDLLFNPVDHDYDNILESCETVLTKELYISPKSSLTYYFASRDFCNYLTKHRVGAHRVDYSNFLMSVLSGRKEKYNTKFPAQDLPKIFQFYLTKEALRFFDLIIDGNVEEFIANLHSKEASLFKVLNRRLSKKIHHITFLHDMRKSLIFFTFLINDNVSNAEAQHTLKNFNNAFVEVLRTFELGNTEVSFDEKLVRLVYRNFQKDVIRRYFFYILKFLLETNCRLNLYIKFQYRQLITALNNSSPINRIYETALIKGKKSIIGELNQYLTMKLPKDVVNNIRLMIHLIERDVTLKKNVSFFYSVFPTEIEELAYSALELDMSGNSEKRTIITDVDAMLIAFQGNKYEFYLIEGKKHKKGFKTKCEADLLKIRSLSNRAKIFSEPTLIDEKKYKGGYIKIVS